MDKIILNIMKKLESSGYSAYIVGGYVRDYVLGKNSYDVDICTNALPKDVMDILRLRKVTQDNYGCVNLKLKNYNVDITTYRKEHEYNDRRPSIEFIDNIKEDLERRDFTMNSLLMDKNEFIIDYFDGVNDIKNKRIKCIGNIDKKLTEDPLRILRAIRFYVIYDLEIDKNIIEFIKNNRSLLSEITEYRIKQELDKMFSSDNKLIAIKVIKELKLCEYLGIEYDKIIKTNDILGIYAQMKFTKIYPFTKSERNIISGIREIVEYGNIDNNILYKYGLYISLIAGEILGIDNKKINEQFSKLPIKNKKDIKINIKTIVKLNNNCYNNVSEIYSLIEDAILKGKIKNNNKEIVKYIRKKV